MMSFLEFLYESKVHDMGDGFTVHHHDLGDGHATMVMFQHNKKTGGAAMDYTVHTPEKPEGTTEHGHIPAHKRTRAIMSVKRSINSHLKQNPDTPHIDMHDPPQAKEVSHNRNQILLGKKLSSVSPLGNGIRIHLKGTGESNG